MRTFAFTKFSIKNVKYSILISNILYKALQDDNW